MNDIIEKANGSPWHMIFTAGIAVSVIGAAIYTPQQIDEGIGLA